MNRLNIRQKIHTTAYHSIQARITALEACDPGQLFAAEVAAIVQEETARMPEPMRGIENTDDYLWPEGIFNLAGHNFGEIIARLESLYGVTISIEKTASPELNIIRGKIPVVMGLDYALRALQKITPFEYESSDNAANKESIFSRSAVPVLFQQPKA